LLRLFSKKIGDVKNWFGLVNIIWTGSFAQRGWIKDISRQLLTHVWFRLFFKYVVSVITLSFIV